MVVPLAAILQYKITQKVSEIGVIMKTGTDAKEPGVYFSQCCDFEVEFSKDQTFTRCPKCSGLTIWEVVDMELPKAA